MKKLSFLTAWAVLLLAAVSCGNPPESSELKFETITAEDSDEQGLDYSIRFTYPAGYGDKAVLDTLQRKFITHVLGERYASLAPREAVDALVADWKKGYDKDMKEMEGAPEYALSYQYSVSDTILFASDTLLQLHTEFFQYAGGAHGMGGSSSHLFSLQTGGEYTQADIFKPEAAEEIRNLIIPEIVVMHRGVQTVYEVEADGSTAWIDNLWTETTNFALTPEGVRFTYSDYEIGSYAFGSPDVTIPYVRIFPCLREGTPVWNAVKAVADEGGIGDSELPVEVNKDLYLQLYYGLPASVMPDDLKTEEQRRGLESRILSGYNPGFGRSNIMEYAYSIGDFGIHENWAMAAYPVYNEQNLVLVIQLVARYLEGNVTKFDKTFLYHIESKEFTEIERPIEIPAADEMIDEKGFNSEALARKAKEYFNRTQDLCYGEYNNSGFTASIGFYRFALENPGFHAYDIHPVYVDYQWDGIRFVKSGTRKTREE